MSIPQPPPLILVTGATGYIANRLIPLLLQKGYAVRCMARQPLRLQARPWFSQVQVIQADSTEPESLPALMQGVSGAYYLIHSMSAGHGYHEVDLQSARNFAQAARQAGVEHIIYLGGLADPQDPHLALHLKSRIQTGEALREAGVPVTEFRAGVIVGPGSVSFEMIRFIAEQFPLMVGPRWLLRKSQPIATSDILAYLLASLQTPASRGEIIELGCDTPRTYIDVMTEYARVRGHKRAVLLLPFIPPTLMALMISLLTPVQYKYALPLVEGLQNDSLVQNPLTLGLFPQIRPLHYPEAILRALADTHPNNVERIWLESKPPRRHTRHEGMFIHYHASPAPAGAALRQPRLLRHWQVESQTPHCLLLRSADLPVGVFWLEQKIVASTDGAVVEQTLFLMHKGLAGALLGHFLLGVLAWLARLS